MKKLAQVFTHERIDLRSVARARSRTTAGLPASHEPAAPVRGSLRAPGRAQALAGLPLHAARLGVVACAIAALAGCAADGEPASSREQVATAQAVRAADTPEAAHAAEEAETRDTPELPETDAAGAADPDAPEAADASLTTDMGTPAALALIADAADAADARAGAVVVTGFSQAAHGSVSLIGGKAIYTPAPGYVGRDRFQYTIADAAGHSSTASVGVAVRSCRPACTVAITGPSSAGLDAPVHLTATAHCTAGTPEIQWWHRAAGGPFRPFKNFSTSTTADFATTGAAPGTHQFVARVRSRRFGARASSNVLEVVLVRGGNHAPIAADDTLVVDEDRAGSVDVLANDRDPDGDALTAEIATPPAAGTATIAGGVVSYAPAANYHGSDAIGYTIRDGHGNAATATVHVTVNPVNDPPAAQPDALVVAEDGSAALDVTGNDSDLDGDALSVTAVGAPAHGSAAASGNVISYAPDPNYHGPDQFTYTISDGNGASATASVAVTVTAVNDPPVPGDDELTVAEDSEGALFVLGNDGDPDGDGLAVVGFDAPAHGRVAIVAGIASYVPEHDYNGPDAFRYTVQDPGGLTATATVRVTVTPVNDPPVAAADAVSLDEDSAATIDALANDRDVDGDALAVTAITQPAHGAATIVDAGHVRYAPDANYHGPDAFGYTIEDGHGGRASAQIALDVASVNDAPVAADGTLATFDGTPAVASLVASDGDGDPLTFAIAAPPAHGTLGALAGARVTYTPAAGFTGDDAFSFIASDGVASSAVATIHVTVTRSECGNGVREGREECDDGNAVAGDGCEASCALTCGSGTGAERATVDGSGHCFAAFEGVQHGYQEAAAMCVAVGGHLPTVLSSDEDAAVVAAARAGDTPWLGANDLASEGAFRWITGEPLAGYSHFSPGKPDNAGEADCVRYLADGTWTDAPCNGPASGASGTVCEFDLVTTTPAFAAGGAGTRAVAVADLNGDGLADIAALNPATGTVGVLLGDGAGGFALQATYATGAGATAIAAGDFDRDGRLDLAVVAANSLAILRGAAGGGLVPGATVAIAAGATSLAVADLDQDGVLDVAIGATGAVQLLRGDGAGGFAALGSVTVTGAVAAIAAGDLDRDGRIDLALTTPSAVLIATATGGGGFAAPVTLASGAGQRAIVAADLDGDGALDLAVASDAGVTRWLAAATGGFGAPATLAVAGVALRVVAGDFDGDGGTDLVAMTASFASVFHGDHGAFAAGPTMATGGAGASFAAVGRLNSDAADDLVVANSTTSTVGVLLGGAAGFTGARALPAGSGAASAVAADFNEDGRRDLAVLDPASSKVLVFIQSATGALVPSATISTFSGAGATYGVASDFDGDGHVDLAIVNVNFSSVSVLLGAGNGTFGAPLNTGVAASPRRPAVGDFNGDGRPDLAVPAAGGNAVTILINTGGGRFGRVGDLAAGAAPAAVVIGDFNGDGKRDLAVATTGEPSVKLLLGRGDTTFAPAVALPVASAGAAIAAGDLDGDGALDLVAAGAATGSVSVLRGIAGGGFAPATSIAVGAQPSSMVVADLDGDGRLDIVVGNAGTSDLTVLHGHGDGAFGAQSFGLGAPPSWLTVADLDHDGHLDIAAASGTSVLTMLYAGR